jgi:activator of HSP90 ATPase
MAKTITQKVVFKNTSPKSIYDLYMDAKKHAASTGWPTKISNKEGSKFITGGDYITGKNLVLMKNAMIVQTWRAKDWSKSDADSIFIITIEQKGKDAILNMIHANVPDKHASNLAKGWTSYYWNKWKAYLAGKPIPESIM